MTEAFKDEVELGALVPTLLDFEQMPGRYRLALREPSLLFEQTHAVMQLAAGRKVAGMAPLGAGSKAAAAQKAARYFVRMVMLRPGADHYALLGLKPSFDPPLLRDHYRLMIRLTHPDFSTPGEDWPIDAASRINMANDVLGSSVKRSEYDAKLQAEKAVPGMPAPAFKAHAPRPSPVPNGGAQATRRAPPKHARRAPGEGWSHRNRMVLAACGAVACVFGLMLVTPSGNEGSLVAQQTPKSTLESMTSTPGANITAVEAYGALTAQNAPDTAARTVSQNDSAGQESIEVALPKPSFAAVASTPQALVAPTDSDTYREKRSAGLRGSTIAQPSETPLAVSELGQTPNRAGPSPSALPVPAPAAIAPAATLTVAPQIAPTGALANGVANTEAAQASAPSPISAPPTIEDVQPLLARVVAALNSGVGEDALDVVNPTWNSRTNRVAFLTGYFQFLQGERITGVNSVAFRSQTAENALVVSGVLNLKVVGVFESASNRELRLRATFIHHKGKPVLTRLEIGNAKS